VRRLIAVVDGRPRLVESHPVTIGGAGCDIALDGVGDETVLLYVALDEDEPYVQPVAVALETTGVSCNGLPLSASQWIRDGDEVQLASSRIRCTVTDTEIRLEAVIQDEPEKTVTATESLPSLEPTYIRPRDFTPARTARGSRLQLHFRPRLLLIWLSLGVLAVSSWYLLTARAVSIVVEPEPDHFSVRGILPIPRVAGRHLLRPGRYHVSATRVGFQALEQELEITRDTPPSIHLSLTPRGIDVTILSRPVDGAAVTVNGSDVGTTPLDGLQLPPGEHQLVLRADLHQPATAVLRLEPGDPPQKLEVDLPPDWALVMIASEPPGAMVLLDGVPMGAAPARLEISSGHHRLELRLSGYKPHRRSFEVTASQPMDLGRVRLQAADGLLAIVTDPPGASISVDGVYAGRSPLEIAVDPGKEHILKLSLAGHTTKTVGARVTAGARSEISVGLEQLAGIVRFTSRPPGAELLIDGNLYGTTDLELELPVRPYAVEVRLTGYTTFSTTVTPDANLEQMVRAVLRAEGPAALPPMITTSQEAKLRLVGPGRFTMGAPRREPGRRANEVFREVEISRSYYLGFREVTNREYREFSEAHRSGAAGSHSLETDHHPVVRITWENAVRYCNWLSEREGLPPVYVERSGALVARSPVPSGYRLPTEAEWAWAARYPDGATPRKYPWGANTPLPADAGNYGDAAARSVLGGALPNYRDGYTTTAPSGSFAANPLGLFNLGGNVAEWVHDFYSPMPGTPGTLEKDPVGPGEGAYHVIRGASWMDNTLTELRLTHRDYGTDARPDVGFRIARSAER